MISKIKKGMVYFYKLGRLLLVKKTCRKETDSGFILFDTSLGSDNLGDQIINDYGRRILQEAGIQILSAVPTHRKPDSQAKEILKKEVPKLIMGTNVGSSHMNHDGVWKKPEDPSLMRNLFILGIGWDVYSNDCNLYTRIFYKKMLNPFVLHSVRDSYSEQKLKKAGIHNVINTACPSMWNLTPEFCREIPAGKAKNVITTVTDYSQDKENDYYMLDQLLLHYTQVSLWLQGQEDYEYIRQYPQYDRLHIIDARLEDYDRCLEKEETEYIGTRLHAGIRALNHKKRTLIIAIDNRALEISKDTNLPVIRRNELKERLEEEILCSRETRITIPQEAIRQWKDQFRHGERKQQNTSFNN